MSAIQSTTNILKKTYNEGGARLLGTTYVNNSGGQILVAVETGLTAISTGYAIATIDGAEAMRVRLVVSSLYTTYRPLFFAVENGSSYSVNTDVPGYLASWAELRA